MDRYATAAFLAELAASKSRPFYLLELRLDLADGGTQRFTDGFADVLYDGNTYYATAYMLSFTGLQESGNLRVHEITVRLSAVDQVHVSAILSKRYLDRALVIHKGFWDASNPAQVVVDPVPIFQGPMDSPSIEDDPSTGRSEVTLAASNHWTDFERRPGRHTNNNEHRIYAPTDAFFQYANEQGRQIVWGGPQKFPLIPYDPSTQSYG